LQSQQPVIIIYFVMKEINEKMPTPKELEKEIAEFLTKKFGGNVKVAQPMVLQQENMDGPDEKPPKREKKISFDLKPEELVAYLDQYIVKQESAKAILATKICTHFNRIKRYQASPDVVNDMVGSIKNNVLMVGPTGVGKTYMIKLIAKKIGVPFVKGDATKFSETGYVGGDVEDLVRDLVREADGDIEHAQHGIIYIDEIDKIASSRNLVGADVSRTGVQRALLKPMEETEVDLKVPHDPISMLQEVENFRKTGKREKNVVNTKNILFIMSGAFNDIAEIVQKRISSKGIGFGSPLPKADEKADLLKHIKSEDLIQFGFESEFVGRLPVRAVFEYLDETDLYKILKNPNNPITLGKKLDFAAYGIDAKFEDKALRALAREAAKENTGARGLVSAVENALLLYEKRLPSTNLRKFPITVKLVDSPEDMFEHMTNPPDDSDWESTFERLVREEKDSIFDYIVANKDHIVAKYQMDMPSSRIDIVADQYSKNATDISRIIQKIKGYYDEIKTVEHQFFKSHDVNLVLEGSAIDHVIKNIFGSKINPKELFKQLSDDFEHGLKLVRDKTGRNRFFITRDALMAPEKFIEGLIRGKIQLN
jgi:ATP-dependent Clp protease ATP-binding subunit ClpX